MDELIHLFVSDQGNYNKTIKFNVLILFILCLVIVTKCFGGVQNGAAIVLVVVFAFTVCDLYLKINNNKNVLGDSNKIIYLKLQSLQEKVYGHVQDKIQKANISGKGLPAKDKAILLSKNKLDSLYIDSNLIIFFYSIIKLSDYNEDEFYMLLKGTNNILKIRKEIETFYNSEKRYTENIYEMFDVAIQLKSNCMNNLQNIIYKVPKTNVMYDYVNDCIQRYSVLINRNMDVLDKYNKNAIMLNGVNNRTKFTDYKSTKPYDRMSNQNIIPDKKINVRNELQQLYP